MGSNSTSDESDESIMFQNFKPKAKLALELSVKKMASNSTSDESDESTTPQGLNKRGRVLGKRRECGFEAKGIK